MSSDQSPPFGVMLVNLGTPDHPDPASVKRYLAEFLSDQRVIQVSRLLWWCVLHGIILRVRPRKVAKLYKTIWTKDGSPLLAYSKKQQQALSNQLAASLGQTIPVELAMTYGKPSIAEAGQRLAGCRVNRIIVLPLYPQYSATTTAAVFDALAKALKRCPDIPELIFIRDYWQQPDYLDALAASVKEHWQQHGQPDRLLMSFHGIPQRYEDAGDPYPSQCRATAEALAKRLNIPDSLWQQSFQSRFGKEEWVKPYTDILLQEWGKNKHIRRVDVICPAFAADCLETLEEIEEQNKANFVSAGGEEYHYIPCLNDRRDHIQALANLVLQRAQAWHEKPQQ